MRFGLGLGLGLGSRGGSGGDIYHGALALEYEIPAAETSIELAIQAAADWFDSGQGVYIDWGDGSVATVVNASGITNGATGSTGYVAHTYAADTGVRTCLVKVYGSMKMYGRTGATALASQDKLTHIRSFGKLGISNITRAFWGCTGLKSVPEYLPSSILNMSQMFRSCNNAAFNPDVSKWDVSSVSNMNSMFYTSNGVTFNPDFSNWDVSSVSDMTNMFYNCSNSAFKGVGIKNWKLRSGAVSMINFMLSANVQPAEWLDDILNAWAALIDDTTNPLPHNVTIAFPSNQPYTGSVSGAALAALVAHGWVISTLVDAEA